MTEYIEVYVISCPIGSHSLAKTRPLQRALQAQSSFDMRPRRADEFSRGRLAGPTPPAIPRVKQMAQFFQSKQE